MPVVSGNTPTVNVSVPVPTPVQAPKRPPVQFRPPAPQPQQVGPSGVPAPQPQPPQLSAVILPWGGDDSTTGKSRMQRVREFLSLFAKRPSLVGEQSFSPVEQRTAAKGAAKRRYNTLLGRANKNQLGVLPTKEEIRALATVGRAVKGQYAHAYNVLKSFMGERNAKIWVAANAILSPQSEWAEHSAGAMRVLRLWHEAGRPTDPKAIAKTVTDRLPREKNAAGGRLYSLYDGVKRGKLIDLFSNPDKYIADLSHVSNDQFGKTPDFAQAFVKPEHSPLDTHQAKLLTPGLADIRKAIGRHYSPKRDDTPEVVAKKRQRAVRARRDLATLHGDLKRQVSETPIAHRLAHAIAGGTGNDLPAVLLNAQKALVSNPTLYKAYKAAVAQTAHEMGWEQRETQEGMWAGVVATVAARNYGIPVEKVLDHLKHEDVFHAWNVGELLTRPEILGDIKPLGLPGRRVENFVSRAKSATPPAGKVGGKSVDRPTYENAARRVPGSPAGGAWSPVESSLAGRKVKASWKGSRALTKRQLQVRIPPSHLRRRPMSQVKRYGRQEVDHAPFHRQILHDSNVRRGQPEKRYTAPEATSSLVYADFLEEHGMPHAAQFVRDVAGRLGGTTIRFPDITAVMEYNNRDRDTTVPLTVFAYQGLGGYAERRRGQSKPKPTIIVSVRSPHPDDPDRQLSFNLDLPSEQAHQWMSRLVGEGHPAGNPEGSPALRRAVAAATQAPPEPTALSRRTFKVT